MTLIKIDSVSSLNPSSNRKNILLNELVPFIAMADVSEEGRIRTVQERKYADVKSGYTVFQHGDILLAKITPCFENGKCALVDIDMSFKAAFGSTEFHIIRPNKNIDPKYLFYTMNNKKFRSLGQKAMTGAAGQRRVPSAFIANYKIPLPPLEEQQRISAILDKADALRRKRADSLKLADEFLKSVFLDMFGDPVTNEKGWDKKKICEVSHVVTGNTPPRNNSNNYGDHLEWIKSDNINTPFHFLTPAKEKISELAISRARIAGKNSILVTCIAGSKECIGNVALSNREVAFNQQINAIVPFEPETAYFIYSQIFTCKKLIQQASTGGMKGLVSKSKFENILIVFPKQTDLIRQFTKIAHNVISLQKTLYEHYNEADDLFKVLQQQFFG